MENYPMTVGVLALQGDFAEHCTVLHSLNVETKEVRTPEDLAACSHLIIPGGESTVMGKLLTSSGIRDPLIQRANAGDLAIFGTCAGAILLAKEILGKNTPEGLGLMDISVDRNAYGTQLHSFEAEIAIEGIGSVPVAFIRAPKITRVGNGVDILASYEGMPVLVRQGRCIASTCHPEVRGEAALHRYFLDMQ